MIAIIRDDDLNISSNIDDIEKAYSGIINKIPINFFVIPELINPQKTWAKQYGDFFWKTLSAEGLFIDNKELMNYLIMFTFPVILCISWLVSNGII